MFVRKKMQVQKSFRIDEDVERDLGVLAKLTERSQNDLANVALEELLQDNKAYFLKVAILEHFTREMESAKENLEPFEMGGIKVEMRYLDDDRVEVHFKDSVEEYSKEFDSDISDEFENYLTELSVCINRESEDTIKYLENRTDYRDYVKIRKA